MKSFKGTLLMVLALMLPLSASAKPRDRVRGLSESKKSQVRSLVQEFRAKRRDMIQARMASAKSMDSGARASQRAALKSDIQALRESYRAKASAIIEK
jgi:hypothetical protein